MPPLLCDGFKLLPPNGGCGSYSKQEVQALGARFDKTHVCAAILASGFGPHRKSLKRDLRGIVRANHALLSIQAILDTLVTKDKENAVRSVAVQGAATPTRPPLRLADIPPPAPSASRPSLCRLPSAPALLESCGRPHRADPDPLSPAAPRHPLALLRQPQPDPPNSKRKCPPVAPLIDIKPVAEAVTKTISEQYFLA